MEKFVFGIHKDKYFPAAVIVFPCQLSPHLGQVWSETTPALGESERERKYAGGNSNLEDFMDDE